MVQRFRALATSRVQNVRASVRNSVHCLRQAKRTRETPACMIAYKQYFKARVKPPCAALSRSSLQCRRILGGRNLVRVRNIVEATISDFMTVEDWVE